jgi:hypothetical protein
MAQGEFTKQEAQATREAFDEIVAALPKGKKMNYIGHMNDIYLFLSAAEKAAPESSK